tara:strand:- start:630 stop:833 length:204 start_codon:yes stop_codon:yes gene_type:complete
MKLYEVPRNSKIRIIDEDVMSPWGAKSVNTGDVLDFHNIDGMYSLSYDEDKNPVHIATWTEVEVLDD